MKNLQKKDNTNCFFLFFSIILFFFGFFLITKTIIGNISFEDNFNNQIKDVSDSKLILHKNFYISFFGEKIEVKETRNPNIGFNNIVKLNLNSKFDDKNFTTLPLEFDFLKNAKTKKEKFIYSILPLIVIKNEKIRFKRKRIIKILKFLNSYKTLYKEDHDFLESLAQEYRINTINRHKIDIIEDLIKSLDEIPNSIVIAQAANESGWGESRFAQEFNALFGQYTFDINQGVVPKFRDEGEKYLIKFFSNVNDSVEAYFKNINTHPAYKDFRENRYQIREKNLKLDPIILVQYLKPYAKDKNYVKIIKSIININKLNKFDNIKTITTAS